MILIRGALCAMVFAGAALPAFAQATSVAAPSSGYESRAMACLDANAAVRAGTMTQEARLSHCETGLAAIDTYWESRTSPDVIETTTYRIHRAFLQLEIGGAYTRIDNARTQRVCVQTEKSWAELSKITDAGVPEATLQQVQTMRTGIRGALDKCRSEFGELPH